MYSHDDDTTKSDPPADNPAPDKKESKMKRTSSKVRTTGKKRTEKKAASTRSRLDPAAKIQKGSAKNPFKEGTGSYERTQLVLKNIGKTVEHVRGLKGLKPTTLNTLVKEGVIKVKAS
jgi:hypothetical protein